MQARIERLLTDLAFGAPLDPSDANAVDVWLQGRGLSQEDVLFLRQQGIERLLTYRRLVRQTLRDAIQTTMPRAVAHLGPAFDDYFSRFLKEQGPRTHYLRDVTPEFLEFCAPSWAMDPRVPSYLFELADHELLQVEVASMLAQPKGYEPEELELDAGVEFIDACRIVHYDHAIHELSEDETDLTPPETAETWLFVYRSPEHEVRYLKLTPLAADILARLKHLKEALGRSITTAAADAKIPLDQQVLDGTARLLADLAERGAIYGKRPV